MNAVVGPGAHSAMPDKLSAKVLALALALTLALTSSPLTFKTGFCSMPPVPRLRRSPVPHCSYCWHRACGMWQGSCCTCVGRWGSPWPPTSACRSRHRSSRTSTGAPASVLLTAVCRRRSVCCCSPPAPLPPGCPEAWPPPAGCTSCRVAPEPGRSEVGPMRSACLAAQEWGLLQFCRDSARKHCPWR